MINFIDKLITGDCVEMMKKMPGNFVDLTITSPPYDSLRTYKGIINEKKYDEYFSFPFCDIVKELWRITKKGGIVVWVVNDQVKDGGESGSSFRQALYFQSVGFKIYDTMIYHKNGPPFPEVGRYSQVFEYMFVFSKGKPKTVNLIKDKENRWAGSSTFGKASMRQKDGTLKKKEGYSIGKYGTRYNVWYINNGKGFTTKDEIAFKHPALFPESLAEDHILSWSNPNDIVFDPMNGAGTTTKMAYMNNRHYIGIDINEEYNKIGEERLKLVEPYTEENPNPKNEFIVSREEVLAKRKSKNKKVDTKEDVSSTKVEETKKVVKKPPKEVEEDDFWNT